MNKPLIVPPDLLSLAGADTVLRKTGRTRGGEYHGSCPMCGGTDRFFVQPNHADGRWYCRRCNPRGDTAVGYIMAREGVTYRQAVQQLQQLPAPPARPAPPRVPDCPDEQWRAEALRLIPLWQERLWAPEGRRALAWLRTRGLSPSSIQEARLGYIPAAGRSGAWHVQRGIAIPVTGVDGALYGIRLRLPVPRDARGTKKYTSIVGSRSALYGTLRGADTLLVVEGYFDCLLAAQLTRHAAVDVATLGLCRPAGRWLRYLLGYRRILVALDVDAAGDAGWKHWSWIGTARQLQLPSGKDITQAVMEHSLDVASWLGETMEPPVPAPQPSGQSPTLQAAPIVRAGPPGNMPVAWPALSSIPPAEDRWMLYNDEKAF